MSAPSQRARRRCRPLQALLVAVWLSMAGTAVAQPDAAATPAPPPPTISDADRAAALAVEPAAIEVSASLVEGKAALGHPFVLFVRVVYEAGTEVSLPGALPLGDDLEESRRTSSTRQRPDGRWVRDFEIELVPWVVGTLAVPPIEVSYAIDGRARTAATAPLTLEVVGMIGNGPEQLRDLAPTVEIMQPVPRLWLFAAAIALLVGVLAVWRWRAGRRRRRRSLEALGAAGTAGASEDPYEQLVALEASGELVGPRARDAWNELAEIVRRVLLKRHGLPIEWTTGELRARLQAEEVDEPLVDEVLATCDLVKFADARPTEASAAVALEIAKARTRRVLLEAVSLSSADLDKPGAGATDAG